MGKDGRLNAGLLISLVIPDKSRNPNLTHYPPAAVVDCRSLLQQDAPEQLERSPQPGVVREHLAARPISCLFSLVFCAGAIAGRKGRTTVKKLYVGNLSFKATEEQIAALFSEIGVQPDSLTLLRDRFT